MTHKDITICRVYNPPGIKVGVWILVDRLWPRGLKKDSLDLDLWLKDIAPSTELRKWFHHAPEKWKDFEQKYIGELQNNKELMESIKEKAEHNPVTLFYAAKDPLHNNAVVLQRMLLKF